MLNSIDRSDPETVIDQQKGSLMHDFKDKLKMSFGNKNNTPKPETHSSPCMDSGPSRVNHSNSEQKAHKMHKIELSKEAQILREKLNIPLQDPHNQAQSRPLNQNEDEKGEQIEEEFDQSRPMTTRIYDNEDDQQLNIQYIKTADGTIRPLNTLNKHMSVEAGGLETSPGQPEQDAIGDEQYSMIIKHVDDLEAEAENSFVFNSRINSEEVTLSNLSN